MIVLGSEKLHDNAIRHSDAAVIVRRDIEYQGDIVLKHATAELVNIVQA